MEEKTALELAKDKFNEILQSLKTEEDRANFSTYVTDLVSEDWLFAGEDEKLHTVEHIIEDLRESLPPNALAPKEKVFFPNLPEYEGFTKQNTTHIDAFLYEDDDVIDDLVDQGQMSRNYCLECGAQSTAPLNFVTHSISKHLSGYIFKKVVPDLDGKTVVDIGSRLGAVLYMGYQFSKASKLIGVEMNKYFCDLQTKMVQKYKMGDRIQVVCADIRNQKDILAKADVIILHNVFECFVTENQLPELWKFFQNATLKNKGCKIISVPALQKSLANAKVKIDINTWVKEVPLTLPPKSPSISEEMLEGFSDVHLYEYAMIEER